MSVNLTTSANQVPVPLGKGGTYLDTSPSTTTSPPLSSAVAIGDTAAAVTKLVRNAVISDALGNAIGFGILAGFTITAGTGNIAVIAAGQAFLHGPLTVPASQNKALALSTTNFLWLQANGAVTANTATPPTAPTGAATIYLGAVTCDGTGVTNVDTSGVVYLRNGGLWRQTADTGDPADTPPSDIVLWTRTQAGLYVWDGTAHTRVGAASVGSWSAGVPSASQVLWRKVFARPAVFAISMPGSKAVAGTAATASTVLSIKKNGTQFATITFAASGTTGTFACAAQTSFAAGDLLTIVAPASPDATLAEIAWDLLCGL